MSKKLVIVESPAKAKTIKQFLGSDYVVEASIGHIRDLPDNRRGMPEALKKKWWADYAVDVDEGFQPYYIVPEEKAKVVSHLRQAIKGADELVLATDEDREGESISWHLLQVLKPGAGVQVKRIAFHEITREAIREALENPRQIDRKLVEAQEARRILDRLYGYTLSPVLWGKVAKELSAGRVQTPAVKLVVDRAKRRRDFVSAAYWEVRAELEAEGQAFPAFLRRVDDAPLASAKDFDELTGKLKTPKALLLSDQEATSLVSSARTAKPWAVANVEKKPGQERPPAPFRTTTLQQEANRKFGFPAERTMRIAQDLYEGVEIGGDRVGLITYMRTDSLNLASSAVEQARKVIRERYGAENLPDKPNRYASKVANAQEAHEAIRPTDFARTPEKTQAALAAVSNDHQRLYDLIYRRTIACQMKPAEVLRTTATIEVSADGRSLEFEATGKEIKFPGFLLAYVEDVDEAEAELEGKERILPELRVGQGLDLKSLESTRKETKPPPRYTDASLIKALEELGIGRPSTYATILSVIEDRGYVKKEKKELIATWLAFLAMEVLEGNFREFTDLKFTAAMDDTLDEIANGERDSKQYLERFFLGGNGQVGLREAVETRKREIPFPALTVGKHPDSGEPIFVRLGKTGRPFVQLGEGESKKYANIPDEVTPEDLTVAKAAELLSGEPAPVEAIGVYPQSGRRLLLKKRGGYYLEVERTPEEVEAKEKPVWVSLPSGVDPRSLSQNDLDYLCSLPVEIGEHPETGDPITFRIGKYGPYIQSGSEIRNAADWRGGMNLTVEECVELLKLPKNAASAKARGAAGPILEFGPLEGAQGPVKVLAGRFGPYVTDGTTNATLPKGTDPNSVTPEMAVELLQKKAAAGPSKRHGGRRRFTGRRRKA
jgi:DNA topoisomerase-1